MKPYLSKSIQQFIQKHVASQSFFFFLFFIWVSSGRFLLFVTSKKTLIHLSTFHWNLAGGTCDLSELKSRQTSCSGIGQICGPQVVTNYVKCFHLLSKLPLFGNFMQLFSYKRGSFVHTQAEVARLVRAKVKQCSSRCSAS